MFAYEHSYMPGDREQILTRSHHSGLPAYPVSPLSVPSSALHACIWMR